MSSDCNIFRDASIYVSNWKSAQQKVKEESLTDWLLYRISSVSPRVQYRAFTRKEEAKDTGADWEWWILFKKQFLRLRIQAKNTWPNHNHYPGIAHTNKYGLQIDKLIKDSTNVNAIAMYAFYTAAPTATACSKNILDEGAYLLGARRVYSQFIATGPKYVSDSDIFSLSTPLSCLLCCPIAGLGIIRVTEFLSRYFAEDASLAVGTQVADIGGPIRGMHTELPNYVSEFLRLSEDEEFQDQWEQEYEDQLSDIGAILVYDARDSEMPIP